MNLKGDHGQLKPFQFKPGQCGNPKGRPKGHSITFFLNKILEKKLDITHPIEKKLKRLKIKEVIALKIVAKCLEGDLKAIVELYDRIEGKAIQRQEFGGNIKKVEVEFVGSDNGENQGDSCPQEES